ncbi:hypothetical protein HZH66_004470 [Vespula vulgaris]|uniref:Uncharacterized protein n=1 Tax=Vespula vulgaris TaxID=7454 RepID=A0A834KCP3_VESVU|nr:hypothetical protein HZH66_004470 [Vespula vulgaris]
MYPPLFGPCEEACGHVSPVYRATGKKRTAEGEQEVYVGELEAVVVLVGKGRRWGYSQGPLLSQEATGSLTYVYLSRFISVE